MKELIFTKKEIIERTRIIGSITNKEWHEEKMTYPIVKNFDIIGIVRIESMERNGDFAIKIVAKGLNIHGTGEIHSPGRKETRRMRIARVLMQHEGEPLTVREIQSELDDRDKDRANLQWEAKLLTQEDKRFIETSKDGRMAYMYRGSVN